MKKYIISINPLADFLTSTAGGKRTIIRQQQNINEVKAFRYALAKSRMRKSLEQNCDVKPIIDGLELLKKKKPVSDWQRNDKSVSIDALEKFVRLKLPEFLKNYDYEVIKNPTTKSVFINDVEVRVSPEVIIKCNIKGRDYYGGIKLHIAKSKPYEVVQGKVVSSLIYKYLNDIVKKDGSKVLPEFCLSIDVFSSRIVSAPPNSETYLEEISGLCEEIKLLWNVA